MAELNYNQVFKTTGIPSITYVKRENRKFELELSSAIQSEGQLCLLTGPSKTGKTTLYTKVLEDLHLNPLIIRCDNELSVEEFWKRSLESIDFARLVSRQDKNTSEISGNSKIKGKLGWTWLAEMVGEISLGVKSTTSEIEIREKVLSKPSPFHLLPILKYTKTVLVIEDFHYLTKQVQKTIFQQWKTFVDSEVSVLVVGTTHHGSDLVSANQDLLGRVVQIELNGWRREDLKKIVEQGYRYLNIHVTPMMKDIITQESVGLPIITQTICRQLNPLINPPLTHLKPKFS